ncbi:MAG TPA: VOC family protein [Novosphingobium sp.]|nr:VOC family protein [Novosphingobium sp.]
MPRLEHWNLRTFDLDATIAFYEEIVGLRSGPFPGAKGQGAWLYDDTGVPVVHVIRLDAAQRDRMVTGISARLGDLAGTIDLDSDGSGVIDHVAFACDDFDQMMKRITDGGHPHKVADYPRLGLRQILVNDPNGVTLELNFRTAGQPGGPA